jgi:isopentenyl-diphosphate delta-isomerase
MTDMIPAWVDGKLTPVEKLEVHQKGLRHKAVSVFIMDGAKVLIQRRSLLKYHTPGLWANTCCTHPHWDENPAECAVRRLDDELGIKGVYPVHRDQIEYRADVGNDLIEHEVVDLFLADTTSMKVEMDPNPREVMDTRWVDIYDLSAEVARRPAQFTPWLQIYLSEHMDKIFGTLVRS